MPDHEQTHGDAMLVNSGQVLTERAKISPEMESLVDPETGERYTFRETNSRANQVANTLLGLKLSPGERVGCLMSNCPRYVRNRGNGAEPTRRSRCHRSRQV